METLDDLGKRSDPSEPFAKAMLICSLKYQTHSLTPKQWYILAVLFGSALFAPTLDLDFTLESSKSQQHLKSLIKKRKYYKVMKSFF